MPAQVRFDNWYSEDGFTHPLFPDKASTPVHSVSTWYKMDDENSHAPPLAQVNGV